MVINRRFTNWIAAALVVGLCVQIIAPVSATQVDSATYFVSRQTTSTAANHEVRFQTPSGIDSASDTITLHYADGFSSISSLTASDVDILHGPTTGLETSETVASTAAAGTWGFSATADTITLTPPTDAAVGEVDADDFIVIRIGTNAGGSNQIVNPATTQTAFVTLDGGFGDFATMSFPIIDADSVSVTATVVASTSTDSGDDDDDGGNGTPPGDSGGDQGALLVISNVQVVNITTNAATVTWTTSAPANSTVNYGTTSAYGQIATDSAYVTQHAVTLTGLLSGVTYHFKLLSSDSMNNSASTGDLTFMTLSPMGDLVISNISVVDITDTSARVTWTTNNLANSRVDYGTTSAYGSFQSDPALLTGHSIQLTNLLPGTTYHFFITSIDQVNAVATSNDLTFKTTSDATPPANVMSFTATGGDAVVNLSWTLPTDPDLAGVRIVRRADGFPTGPTDGDLVYIGLGVSTIDTNVTNGTTYYYGAFAFDGNANYSSGALAQATPQGALVPEVPPEEQPIPTEPEPTPEGVLITIAPEFYAAGGTVQLVPDSKGQFGVLGGQTLFVSVPITNLGVAPDKGYVSVGSAVYNLLPNSAGTAYVGTIMVPSALGPHGVTVTLTFQDGGTAVASYTAVVQSGGKVVEEDILGSTDLPVDGAEVTLFVEENGAWTVWNGTPYGQANPQIADANGGYVFIVPNGRYYAEVEKNGYRKTVVSPRTVTKAVFGERVGLVKVPPSPFDVISPDAPLIENIGSVVQNIAEQAEFGATQLRVTLQAPEVQETVQTVVTPSLLGVSILNIATALPAFNAFAYLQYLFTQPILVFGRRRRRKWGVVYNSLSKQPVELAIVRLLDAKTRLVLQSIATGKLGRFSFFAKPGSYLLDVVKPGYLFPTQYLKAKTQDVEFLTLYHGEALESNDPFVVAANIPLDPVTRIETPRRVILKSILRRLQKDIAILTVIASFAALAISPTPLMAVIAFVQLAVFLLFRKLGMPARAKDWGMVVDQETGKPLDRVIVRIFDREFNKLLETRVTEGNGTYGFFVRRNVYYVTAEREGYETHRSEDIDLRETDEAVVDYKIFLKKAKK